MKTCNTSSFGLLGAVLGCVGMFLLCITSVYAQETNEPIVLTEAASAAEISTTTNATTAAEKAISNQEKVAKDTTVPEELPEKVAVFSLFEKRPVESPGPLSFMAYWVQKAAAAGIPTNTIFLILLTAVLATLVSFVRVVIGLPTLDMLVPIALAFAFVAMGVFIGLFIIAAIILASYTSKTLLKKTRIMFYPKRSLSMFLLAIFVLAALTLAAVFDFKQVLSISIFPVLILILLGDAIVSVQLYKSFSETTVIAASTLLIGVTGYIMATSETTRDLLLLYPEIVLLTVPINLIIGRYFGLRLVEYFRFNTLVD